jgi:hypothetical protein
VAASAITTAWHHIAFRQREVRAHRAMCRHAWGPLHSVSDAGHMWYRHCLACGQQQNCNKDGSEYKPMTL